MEDRHEPMRGNRRGSGDAPTVMSPLLARARGQDRERRAHGYRSRVPTDSSAAAVSTRRFQLQQSQVPTAQHLRPAPAPAPEPEPAPRERDPVISRTSQRVGARPEVADWIPGDGSTFDDDWSEPKAPRRMHLVVGGLAVVVLGLLVFTVTRGRSSPVVPMVAALPSTLELGAGRPTFERPAPEPTPAPPGSAAPAEPGGESGPEPARAATKTPAPKPAAPRAATAAASAREAAPPAPRPAPRTEPVREATPAAELAAIIESPPPEGEHRAYITSRPAGATVILEGRVVGVTPTHVTWSGKRRQEVEINLPGHDSSTLVLTPKSSGRTLGIVLDEAIDELDPPAPAPQARPSTPPYAPASPPRAAAPAPEKPAPAPPAAPKKSVLDGAFDGF